MTPEEREQHNHVKIRIRGEQYQVVNAYNRKILHRCYYEDQAFAWCEEHSMTIVEKP